jgi:indolepyruvate ferredoxin oxidoreductase alpha subunit
MGAGVTLREGLFRAMPDQNFVGVLGDSTFVHSGITGLINAVYNKAKGLVIVLDNSITAMTGGQEHPGTGLTIKGQPTKKLILEDICRACGVDNVDVIDPCDITALEKLVSDRISEDAFSVIIARSPCKMIDKSRKPAVTVDDSLCKKCGLCLKIDCPAIRPLEDSSIEIDPDLCTGCNLCVQVCPFNALKKNEQ